MILKLMRGLLEYIWHGKYRWLEYEHSGRMRVFFVKGCRGLET